MTRKFSRPAQRMHVDERQRKKSRFNFVIVLIGTPKHKRLKA